MNLIKFLLYGAVISTVLGEFGRFPFGSSSGAIYISDILVMLCLMFFAIWSVTLKKVEFPKQFFWLMGFWIAGLASLVFSLTFLQVTDVLKGGMYLVRFILYSSLVLVGYSLSRKKVLKVPELTNLLIITGVTILILGFLQLLLVPDLDLGSNALTNFGFDPHQGRLTSTFFDPNFIGVYLIFTLSLVIYKFGFGKAWKQTGIVIGLGCILGIILTFSRSAYLMAVVVISLLSPLLWKVVSLKQKVLIFLISVCLVITSLFVFPRFYQRIIGGFVIDKSAFERMLSWDKGLKIFQYSPIIGVGFNTIRPVSIKLNLIPVFTNDGGHSGAGIDSSIILVMATTGLLGLGFFTIFWIKIFKAIFFKNHFATLIGCLLVGLLVNAQFINSLFFVPIMLWYFPIVGLLLDSVSRVDK